MKFFLGGLSNLFTEFTLIENPVKEADTLDFYGILMPDHYMWGQMEWARRADTNTTLET